MLLFTSFTLNVCITFINKRALTPVKLPATLTFCHMLSNSIGSYVFVYVLKRIERKQLTQAQKRLMFYFSLIFVSNIITGNWSLGLISVSLNQILRALVPSCVLLLSIVILKKSFSWQRKATLIPIFIGVYISCTGDKTTTVAGLVVTALAILFSSLKGVLSSKFLSDLNLHPIDLVLYQAPLSAIWCAIAMFTTGEVAVLMSQDLTSQLPSFVVSSVLAFALNVASFYTNRATSALTMSVAGNAKQALVIVLSVFISNDYFTAQKAFGVLVVMTGCCCYTYFGYKDSQREKKKKPEV